MTEDLEVVRPGDAAYATLRHVYTATGSPAQVFVPRDPGQVVRAVDAALSLPGPMSIRSGGHGTSSVATNEGGSVVDLRRLDAVEHLGGTRVRIGAGARWGAVAMALDRWGLAITSGDSGDVGVGGLALGGGIGLLGRAQGLTIDRVRAVEVVTLDGRMLRASSDEHPDLFWALRGAGSSVAVATSFELGAGTTPRVVRASLAYSLDRPAELLAAWGAAMEAAPREVSAFLYVMGGPGGIAQATIVHAGDDETTAQRALEPFVTLGPVVHAEAAVVPYASVPLTTGAVHSGQQGATVRAAIVRHLDDQVARAAASVLQDPAVAMLQIRSLGGAINDVAPDATAFAHRHQSFSVTAVAPHDSSALDRAWAPLRALRDGLYLGLSTRPTPEDVDAAFPPRTRARLRRIARTWDPDHLLGSLVV